MRNVLLSLLVLVCVWCCCHTPPCVASESDGVMFEERILNLPQDQNKWHISIVGSGQQYNRILRWFGENPRLISLRKQVHFRPVRESSAIFKSRYAMNTGDLPVVRVQEADGTLVYESANNAIPYTADGLYGAIADSSLQAQGILRPWRHGGRPWLPWRRQMDERYRPQPTPAPVPGPVVDPYPPIDGGPPVFDEEVVGNSVPVGVAVLLIVLSAIAGGGAGLVIQWKDTYKEV